MGFAARALALCVLTGLSFGTARAQSLDAFLERMRAATGDPSQAHLRSTSSLAVAGRTDELVTESQGLRFWTRRCNGAVCTGTYFDGTRLYAVNINGTTLPQSRGQERALRGLRTASSLAFLSRSFTAEGGRLRDLGWVRQGARRYREIYVAGFEALPVRVEVDDVSARVARVRDDAGVPLAEYGAYARVGPYVLPFEVRRAGEAPERYADRRVVPAPFAPPSGPAFALIPNGGPMALDPSQAAPIGACTIAGVAARCMIDTGNSGLALGLEFSERLGLEAIGAYDVRGLGSMTAEVVRTGPLQAGNALVGDADYVVIPDLERYGCDAVLGADLLAASAVEIDPQRRALRFGASARQGASTVALAFEGFVPLVEVRFGDIAASLAIDTGDQSGIDLSYDFYKKHSDLFVPTGERTVAGIGGEGTQLMGTIPEVEIGGIRLRSQSIGATTTLRGTAAGHLGAGFLARFVYRLDYRAEQMDLEERDDATSRYP